MSNPNQELGIVAKLRSHSELNNNDIDQAADMLDFFLTSQMKVIDKQ